MTSEHHDKTTPSQGHVMTNELRSSGDHRSVHLEREYDTTPLDLWRAWTQPDRLARWLGTPAGPIIGATGPVRISMGEDDNDWVEVAVVSADAPNLLQLSWEFTGEAAGRLRVQFVPVTANRTRVILDHDGLDVSSTGYGAGWQAFLEGPLAALFGEIDDQAWTVRFDRALPDWRAMELLRQG